MSLEQLEQTVISLPPEERRRFANWFYEHEPEILGAEFTDATRREVLRRADELQANRALSQPVDDDYFDRMKRRVADALAGKTPAR